MTCTPSSIDSTDKFDIGRCKLTSVTQCCAVPLILLHGKYREKIPRYSVVPWLYYPRDAMLARVFATATCLSVRPSVCLSRAGLV